jgi:hypothetical protein
MHDSDGLRAWSLNDASRRLRVPRHFLGDPCPETLEYLRARSLPPTADAILSLEQNRHTKWPLQRMPTITHVLTDLMVLRRAAHLLGERASLVVVSVEVSDELCNRN